MIVPSIAPDHLPDARAERMCQRLLAAARSLGYTVEEDYLDVGRHGIADLENGRLTVEVRLSVASQAASLAHQLGHALRCEADS